MQALAFVGALTGSDPNTAIIDVRLIHDTNKETPAIPRRGRLCDLWKEIIAWQTLGYGCFININEMNGNGRYEIANVKTIRCQAIDLDGVCAIDDYQRACAFNPPPSFAVQSSPNRFHVYWTTQHHNDHDKFTLLQRKLRTLFNGDRTIIDSSRVLRVPGTLHLKRPQEPHLITCWSLGGYGQYVDPFMLEIALAGVDVTNTSGGRHPLGDPSLTGPGPDWCEQALLDCDPNNLDRHEWIAITAAWKQAAWLHYKGDDGRMLGRWLRWCEQYEHNNVAENLKQWGSIRETELGWNSLLNKIPSLNGRFRLGELKRKSNPLPTPHEQQQPMPVPTGELLTDSEQREWFKGCHFVTNRGEILTPDGFMNTTQFNGAFGGKKFVIDALGKTTDEPWKAATRSTLWTVPKVNHTRFLPGKPFGEIIVDQLGRKGVNTYRPAIIDARPGDITPFINHFCEMMPDERDRNIILDYLAHNIQRPGYKIPWAPLIQSAEGVGKNLFKLIMQRGLGENYVHEPKTKELLESGVKFNGWMREKLFIIADEIKSDDKRDLIETLKPIISEARIEVQSKGVDQVLEDNAANWLFFSNHKDAIPIDKNGRRYAVFYSAIQSHDDLSRRNMDDRYFRWLYDWLRSDGAAHVVHWLQQRAVGAIPMRAPDTTSKAEAIQEGHTVLETIILQMVRDELDGCRQGWISAAAVKAHWPKDRKAPLERDIEKAIRNLGYHYRVDADGKPIRKQYVHVRGYLFSLDRLADVERYVSDQGKPLSDGTIVAPTQPMPGRPNVIALRSLPNG
ncbi:DUF5906 domain-containing protein [Bradyrhizobium sp. NAS96.2]|uniref:DUF5906 domain-containing protein n=1 Tax=Bradyrhizobium sp. NAS96.2 TaxID=1680160 RepID=UPI00143D0D89|nr:DUF5906 domain-containing protein [Bradyrhizobium sp. NAS96.2]